MSRRSVIAMVALSLAGLLPVTGCGRAGSIHLVIGRASSPDATLSSMVPSSEPTTDLPRPTVTVYATQSPAAAIPSATVATAVGEPRRTASAVPCPRSAIDALGEILSPDSVVTLHYTDRHYQVFICSDHAGFGYYGRSRATSAHIALLAHRNGSGFEADNGNVQYIVTSHSLEVWENGTRIYPGQ